jgi:hypothetical protein
MRGNTASLLRSRCSDPIIFAGMGVVGGEGAGLSRKKTRSPTPSCAGNLVRIDDVVAWTMPGSADETVHNLLVF